MNDKIVLEIIEAEGRVLWVTASGPWGVAELIGSLRLEAGIIYLDGVHIGGGQAGRLGRAGLNAIARKILEEMDADEIIVQGSVRTSGRNPGRAPRAFRFPHPKRSA